MKQLLVLLCLGLIAFTSCVTKTKVSTPSPVNQNQNTGSLVEKPVPTPKVPVPKTAEQLEEDALVIKSQEKQ